MKIACLQFAPQVGDINNNLNRADSVLNKASPENLEHLDLLVLPELAFTGYNFKSLNQIAPFLEHSGSGVSSLWARTNALKYDCNVVVGYPEKVDVAATWPTSPEYYNSAIMVNRDGETIANYRKSFLYMVDETWALEGRDGFFEGYVPGLGNTAMGICMDLNPYKFEAPWDAFEFAFHILEIEANLVIVTMAWLTREDARGFSRMPQEPDMETLTYWVQRLEPTIRNEDQNEIIVVFCNRTGIEGDIVYAGTSAVIGIKAGEVSVYGLLGRGDKDLLVVDTDDAPFAKLVQRPDAQAEGSDHRRSALLEPTNPNPGANQHPESRHNDERDPLPDSQQPHQSTGRQQAMRGPVLRPLQIPAAHSSAAQSTETSRARPRSTADESPVIPTPTAPSPTPLSMRPKFALPSSRASRQLNQFSPSSHHDEKPSHQSFIQGGHVSIHQDEVTPISGSEGRTSPSVNCFWRRMDASLMTPPEDDSTFPNSAAFDDTPEHFSEAVLDWHQKKAPSSFIRPRSGSHEEVASEQFMEPKGAADHSTFRTNAPSRPSSPKSRNTSRSRPDFGDTEALDTLQIEWAQQLGALSQRPDSAFDVATCRRPGSAFDRPHTMHNPSVIDAVPRPPSTKSRNASRSRPPAFIDGPERNLSLSQASIPIAVSPSIFNNGPEPPSGRPQSTIYFRPSSRIGRQFGMASANGTPAPDNYAHERGDSVSNTYPLGSPSQIASILKQDGIVRAKLDSRPQSTAGTRVPTPGLVDLPPDRLPTGAMVVSRGRQRTAKPSPTYGSLAPDQSQQERHSSESQPGELNVSSGTTRKENLSDASNPSEPPLSARSDGSDEVIATIDRICHQCPVHGGNSNPDDPNGNVIYEVSLPAHIQRGLVEPFRGSPYRKSSAQTPEAKPGTPHFDPPTPKAMVFDPREVVGDANPAPLSSTNRLSSLTVNRPKSMVF